MNRGNTEGNCDMNPPKGATVPTDHLKSAAQIEAEGVETVDVEWRGLAFAIVADADDYPLEAVMAFERGQNFVGLELILGPKQWAEFMKTKPKKSDGVDLMGVMNDALGFGDSGE